MLPTTEPETNAEMTVAPSRRAAGGRLPDIFIQALFTLVAVVLAFAVEEWREERELDRIVDEARLAIVEELKHNRDELLESRTDTTDTIAVLESALSAPGEPASAGLRELSFELALLSSAAWRSAQSTDVARRIDPAWMLQVARAYELQTMYEQAQWNAIEANMMLKAATDDGASVASARALRAHLGLVSSFSQSLEGDYADILGRDGAGS